MALDGRQTKLSKLLHSFSWNPSRISQDVSVKLHSQPHVAPEKNVFDFLEQTQPDPTGRNLQLLLCNMVLH